MDEFYWIIILAVIFLLAPIVLAIVAMSKVERISRDLFKMRNELTQLRAMAAEISAKEQAQTAVKAEEKPVEQSAVEQKSATKVAAIAANDEKLVESDSGSIKAKDDALAARASLEENLTGKWFIWIGAIAIALAGLFLVKYMSDAGLLGPGMRVILGLLGGAALTVGGEWLRRRPSQKAGTSLKADYVPQAISAGGLATVFASIYAASSLYGFIGPNVTFIGLALAALAAFALSVIQGPLVAIVGLLGGFALPILMESDDPFAPGLFGYFAILFIAVCAVMVWRQALWLALSTLSLSGLWVFIWAVGPFEPGDALTLGLFSALIGTGFAFAGSVVSRDAQPALWHRPWWPKEPLQMAAHIGAKVALVLILIVMIRDGFGTGSLIGLGAFAIAACVAAMRAQRFDVIALSAGAAVLLGLSAWAARLHLDLWLRDFLVQGQSAWGGDVDAETSAFMRTAIVFGVAALVAGYVLLWRSVRPWVWATLGSIIPIGLMVITYANLRQLEPDLAWSFAALGLAAVFSGLTARVRNYAMDDAPRLALGIYAMAVCASIAMALAFMLRDAWLSASLSMLLLATVYIANQLHLPQLRWPAAIIALVVLVRLTLNLHVLDYEQTQWLGKYWVIYGYGLPLLMFHLALKGHTTGTQTDLFSRILQGGRLALLTMLVSAIIRVSVAGSLSSDRLGLLESGLHITSWLTSAAACWWRWSHNGGFIDKWGGRILTLAGCGLLVFGPVVLANPLLDRMSIGNWPLVNALAPAYLFPALLIAFIGYTLRNHAVMRLWQKTWAPTSLLLLLVWLSMEVRRFYHAPDMLHATTMSTPENYTYSAVWLIFALLLLAAGIFIQRAQLRYASLAVLVLVVLKVFLIDMSDLEGLLRVASFLGLGLCLVGIGFIYQRFVHQTTPGKGAVT
ncbi:MAG: DUF2339 domain-containing protein [Anderseniella sp.]